MLRNSAVMGWGSCLQAGDQWEIIFFRAGEAAALGSGRTKP